MQTEFDSIAALVHTNSVKWLDQIISLLNQMIIKLFMFADRFQRQRDVLNQGET